MPLVIPQTFVEHLPGAECYVKSWGSSQEHPTRSLPSESRHSSEGTVKPSKSKLTERGLCQEGEEPHAGPWTGEAGTQVRNYMWYMWAETEAWEEVLEEEHPEQGSSGAKGLSQDRVMASSEFTGG